MEIFGIVIGLIALGIVFFTWRLIGINLAEAEQLSKIFAAARKREKEKADETKILVDKELTRRRWIDDETGYPFV